MPFAKQAVRSGPFIIKSTHDYFQWPKYEHRLRQQVGTPLWFSLTLSLKMDAYAQPRQRQWLGFNLSSAKPNWLP